MKINTIELREHQRVHLGKAAPLPAPLSLYLEPTSICNMRCEFCPTGDPVLRRRRPNGTMDLALVEKLLRLIRHAAEFLLRLLAVVRHPGRGGGWLRGR